MTTSSTDAPTAAVESSGYVLQRVYATRASFEGVVVTAEMPDSGSPYQIGWDWRIIADRTFEVILSIKTQPTKQRPERVEVVQVGRFQMQGAPPPSLVLPRFVAFGAPTILMAYVRETVSNLTGRGFYGPLFLDPVNLPEVLKGMDMSATSAAKQLRANPKVGAGFGDVAVLTSLPPGAQ